MNQLAARIIKLAETASAVEDLGNACLSGRRPYALSCYKTVDAALEELISIAHDWDESNAGMLGEMTRESEQSGA
jgi:hypothetical protein